MQNKGFTLAETLITLGIVGIVAAMTMPVLISNYQKRVVETKLKEDYSIIQQAMMFSNLEDFDFTFNDNSVDELNYWFKEYMLPHIKVLTVCYETAGCWQASGPTKNLAGNAVPYNRTGVGVGYNIIAFRLINGSSIIIDSYSKGDISNYFGITINDSRGLIFLLDVNGDSRPNIFGKDIYALAFTEKGLIPAGADVSVDKINNNCSSSATTDNAGYYCLAKVQNDGWVIPDDVWNKKI